MWTLLLRSWLLSAAAYPVGRPAAAAPRPAPYRTTLELRLNSQAQQVELALRLSAADLQKALSAGQPRPVDLSQPQALPLAELYLRQHLKLSLPAAPRQPRRPLDVQLQGLRAERNNYWLYAKAPLPQPTRELLLRQDLLLELYPTARHLVRAEGYGKKISAVLRQGHEEMVLNF